jgi:nitrogen regulatory protein P-II 1
MPIQITHCSNVLLRSETKPIVLSQKTLRLGRQPKWHSFCVRKGDKVPRPSFKQISSGREGRSQKVKRIEAVITPWTLDAFREAAPQLGIVEFDLVEIYRSDCATIEQPQRLYRGRGFTIDLLPRLRLEFVLFDDDVQATVRRLLELIHPDSIAIFKLDQELRPISPTNDRPNPLFPSITKSVN